MRGLDGVRPILMAILCNRYGVPGTPRQVWPNAREAPHVACAVRRLVCGARSRPRRVRADATRAAGAPHGRCAAPFRPSGCPLRRSLSRGLGNSQFPSGGGAEPRDVGRWALGEKEQQPMRARCPSPTLPGPPCGRDGAGVKSSTCEAPWSAHAHFRRIGCRRVMPGAPLYPHLATVPSGMKSCTMSRFQRTTPM